MMNAMKPVLLLALGTLTLASSFAAPALAERVCISRDRDGRVVCGERVRRSDGFRGLWGSDRDRWDRDSRWRDQSRFDEDFYLRRHRDVRRAVQRGDFSSGYEHYIKHGRAEGREARFD